MEMLLSSRSATVLRDSQTSIAVLLGALFLMAPIAVNGGAIVYFDTAAYVEQIAKGINAILGSTSGTILPGFESASPDRAEAGQAFGTAQGDKVLLAGRSAYYGALAYAGWKTSMWLPVAVQCLALSWLVVRLFRLTTPEIWARASFIALTVLALLTPAAFFAGLIMPDIWAGLMVLALALLWSQSGRLSRSTRLALFAIIAFAVLVHKSHLALLCVLCIGYAALSLLPRTAVLWPRRGLALPLLALGCGVVGHMAVSLTVREVYGVAPISRPHLTAHLVDLGPGTDFARESCPESGFALCAFVDILPVNWIEFLFSREAESGVFVPSSAAVKQALSDEQMAFALGTLKSRPVETVTGLAWDGVAQFWTLSLSDVPLTSENADFLESRFPQNLVQMTQGTALYNHPEAVAVVTRITQATTAVSGVLLIALLCFRPNAPPTGRGRDPAADGTLTTIAAVCLAGLLANALVCGILASPYGRFQARIVWILPLLVCLFLAARSAAAQHAKSGLRAQRS